MRKIMPVLAGTALAMSLSLSAFGVSDTTAATTQVIVSASITLTGVPASLNFGTGVPTDVKTLTAFTAKVTTNNTLGYQLKVTTSALAGTGTNTDTIPAAAINYGVTTSVTGAVAVGGPGNATTGTILGTKALASGATGDNFAVTPALTIPFVNSDTYNGTASFVASTI